MRVSQQGGGCSLHHQIQTSGAASPCSRANHRRASRADRCLVTLRLQDAEIELLPCSDAHRQSFGDLAGLDRPPGLPPLRVDSGKGRLAFSNPQPTAFPSHALNVSVETGKLCCAVRSFSGCTQ